MGLCTIEDRWLLYCIPGITLVWVPAIWSIPYLLPLSGIWKMIWKLSYLSFLFSTALSIATSYFISITNPFVIFWQCTCLDLDPPSPQGFEQAVQAPSTHWAAHSWVLQVWLVGGFRPLSQRLSSTTSSSSRDLHVTVRVWNPENNNVMLKLLQI